MTFNYDTLLEDAMPTVGVTISHLADYVDRSHFYKVFKLHGSVDWARAVGSGSPYSGTGYTSSDPWSIARNHIQRAASLKIGETFTRIDQHPVGLYEGRVGLVPAIAIPVEKKAYFECPPGHLDALKGFLPHVDRLLLVGSRATEDHFLALLRDNLRSPLKAQVVAESETEARKIARDLQDGPFTKLEIDWKFAPAGFTDFVVNRRAEAILSLSVK